MADDDTSFDPKTWLDPKPKDRSQETQDDEVGFDPKTWVQPAGTTARSGQDTPADTTSASAASSRAIASIAGGLFVVLGSIGGAVWFLGDSGAKEKPAAETLADDVYNKPAEGALDEPTIEASGEPAPYPGRQQVLSVSGYQGLLQSLLDLGVPAPEAGVLGRDAVAGLGTDTEEWLVEVWVSEGESEKAVEFMSARLADGKGVELTRGAGGSFEREDVFSQVTRELRQAGGFMGDHDFYTVAVNAGIPDSLTSEFARVFSYDFSFADEVQAGDAFEAMWEAQVDERGTEVAPPRLVYARMETAKGEREYFAFTPPGEIEAQWFSPQGLANVRSLLRTPVDGARISSQFGFRNHPIRQQRLLHGGVDFAAPTGTPVYASGNATVQFRGFHNRAGNFIRLDHGEGMITRYLHLDEFADGLAVGQTIKQGDTIGYVGSTGGSTGPHLHYEIIIDGEKLDPLTFDTSTVEPLIGDGLTMFDQHRSRMENELD
jgi:Peptidase family M23